MKLIRKGIWFLLLGLLAYGFILPTILDQKEKEWKENGMLDSVLETLDPNQNQEE